LPSRNYFDTIFGVSPSTAPVASSPKQLDRVRWQVRLKHYRIRTEQAYVDWIRVGSRRHSQRNEVPKIQIS
jgi:hypothetical protein